MANSPLTPAASPNGHRVQLTIDGQAVAASVGSTILHAAREIGVAIPTLCDDDRLEHFHGCRMCLVEVEGAGRPVPACSTPARSGMVVQTATERVQRLRKAFLELIFSDHNAYCLPPCQTNCPTHVNIPGFLAPLALGNFREAVRVLKETLPFPATLGKICPRPCQTLCRRTLVEEEVSVCQSHGFAGEQCLDDPPTPWPQEAPTGKRVAVIGAGPAGLANAYYLALKGHAVTVFEALPKPGGMLRYGIPEYRLPKKLLDNDIDCVWQLGVELRCNQGLGKDFSIDDLFRHGYDAVFLGIGAQQGNALGAPGEDLEGVVSAVDILQRVGLGEQVKVGRRVVVIGGGFTAADATRTAVRLGAQEVRMVYRRSRKEMPAHEDEIHDAEEEGVKLELLAAPVRVLGENGKVTGIEVQRMRLGEPDARGRRSPVPIEGSNFIIECDMIISAIGQVPDLTCLANEQDVKGTNRQTIASNAHNYMTGRPGVFTAGDAQIGAATVVQAIFGARMAAKAMDGYLRGEGMAAVATRLEAEERPPVLLDIVPYKPRQRKEKMPMLAAAERKTNFRNVELGYGEEQARREADRCLQCTCPAAGRCQLQKLGIEHNANLNRFHGGDGHEYRDYQPDYSHSFILREPNKCILCAKCVRICRDVTGADCYTFAGSGFNAIVTTPYDQSLNETRCISCGACAKVCPTGALLLRDREIVSYEINVSRCVFCGDCVEVCPHEALGVSANFELATYRRFEKAAVQATELAAAPKFSFANRGGDEANPTATATRVKGDDLAKTKHGRRFERWGE